MCLINPLIDFADLKLLYADSKIAVISSPNVLNLPTFCVDNKKPGIDRTVPRFEQTGIIRIKHSHLCIKLAFLRRKHKLDTRHLKRYYGL